MFIEFIAIAISAAVAYLMVFALNRLLKNALPRWLMPVAAGLALIAATINLEYSWFERTSGSLPDNIEVVYSAKEASVFRPWTFIKPLTTNFVAVDTANLISNTERPDVVVATTLHYARFAKMNPIPAVFDCEGGRMSPVPNLEGFLSGDNIDKVTWINRGMDDPLVAAVCKGRA